MALSTHARAAKAVRQHLKQTGVPATVRTTRLYGHPLVSVALLDPPQEAITAVQTYLRQHPGISFGLAAMRERIEK